MPLRKGLFSECLDGQQRNQTNHLNKNLLTINNFIH
ncbi:Josephin domain containing 3, isoform CRA_a [Rattus norvegicus]|uniref:Josephin domain containing 3, isoform CRA_a n=1 Tax=Rattus norvegicus TaxID=10116 RepID=A6JNC8_RAT|nr:Josephin domain containing 3, isoform CRA_a [Rattus norvegicus]